MRISDWSSDVCSSDLAVPDVRDQLTPLLSRDADTEIWLLGLGAGRQRLGGSILSQCFDAFGGAAPDLDDPQRLRRLFELVRDARRETGSASGRQRVCQYV